MLEFRAIRITLVGLCGLALLLALTPLCGRVSAEDNPLQAENAVTTTADSVGQEMTAERTINAAVGCSYRTHVQNVGWQGLSVTVSSVEPKDRVCGWRVSKSNWKMSAAMSGLNIPPMSKTLAGRIM